MSARSTAKVPAMARTRHQPRHSAKRAASARATSSSFQCPYPGACVSAFTFSGFHSPKLKAHSKAVDENGTLSLSWGSSALQGQVDSVGTGRLQRRPDRVQTLPGCGEGYRYPAANGTPNERKQSSQANIVVQYSILYIPSGIRGKYFLFLIWLVTSH